MPSTTSRPSMLPMKFTGAVFKSWCASCTGRAFLFFAHVEGPTFGFLMPSWHSREDGAAIAKSRRTTGFSSTLAPASTRTLLPWGRRNDAADGRTREVFTRAAENHKAGSHHRTRLPAGRSPAKVPLFWRPTHHHEAGILLLRRTSGRMLVHRDKFRSIEHGYGTALVSGRLSLLRPGPWGRTGQCGTLSFPSRRARHRQ